MKTGFQNLRALTDALHRQGDLVTITAEVNPHLELPEIHRRVIAAGGPALLFKNVKGASFPLVCNLFGSQSRVDLAFGNRARDLIGLLASAPERLLPPSLKRLWQERQTLRALFRVGMKHGRPAPVLASRMEPPELRRLPLTTSWPGDGGAFLTLGLVYTEHPETGIHNLGLYRMQRHGDRDLGIHWQIGKGGGFHFAEAESAGQPLPVNVFLGGPPATVLGATAPLPENVPELLLASLALGSRISMTRNPSGPLPILSQADFCLVGEVLPGHTQPEGPFGDHYGYYSLQHDYPVFRCKAVHHRSDAVFPATVVGKPRQEDFYIGDYIQELLSPLFPLAMPGVRSLWSYGETGFHSLSAAVVQERYRREAMASAFRILGEGQLSLTKFLLVLDEDLPLRDFKKVLVHVLERADFRNDLYIFGDLSMDSLDYAGPRVNEGSKGVLLALGEKRRSLPSVFEGAPPPQLRDVEVYCPGCLVVDGASHAREPDLPRRVARDPAFLDWPLIVLADDARHGACSTTNFLWTTFTRFDPAADIHAKGIELQRNRPTYFGPVVIDARMKSGYPPELRADPQTAELVDRRWQDYFPAGGVEMGDSEQAHLDTP